MKVILSLPDEGYSNLLIRSLPDEGYSESTWWRLFQKRVVCIWLDIYLFSSDYHEENNLWYST